MTISILPPVGQRVLWQPAPSPTEHRLLADQRVTWLASGTAALAVAIQQALALDPSRREVILPGYGCPDLIAACIHAGALPRLVDCAPGDPGFDLDALRQACGPATAAVVAVNFLGIRERLPELHDLATAAGATLIEDCAQWFPETPAPVLLAAQIISFGRGKPVNLLGGGALLLPSASSLSSPPAPATRIEPLSRLKARLFNRLMHPLAYGAVSCAPGLQLGTTRYHPLTSIEAIDPVRHSLAAANIDAWLRRRRWREDLLDSELRYAAAVRPLSIELAQRRGRLLRYPVLCADRAVRDGLLSKLAPLGASAFYGRALAEVDGVQAVLTPAWAGAQADHWNHLPHARDFAARLLTLPVHNGVGEYQLRRLAGALRAV